MGEAATMTYGHQMLTLTCGRCGVTCERRWQANQPPPLYCGMACARGAKRQRKAAGATIEPPTAVPPRPCPACGTVARLKRRCGFLFCPRCLARLNGACMRKAAYGSWLAAVTFAIDRWLDQYPYQCALCTLWHLTSADTANEMPGDVELGIRMRAAGFSRQPTNRSGSCLAPPEPTKRPAPPTPAL